VEMLEQGLATRFPQMLQLKTDADPVPPQLAKKVFNLSSQLYDGRYAHSPVSIVEDSKKLLEEIHKQPGFEHFLRPKSSLYSYKTLDTQHLVNTFNTPLVQLPQSLPTSCSNKIDNIIIIIIMYHSSSYSKQVTLTIFNTDATALL
jgi:hypothetical protein